MWPVGVRSFRQTTPRQSLNDTCRPSRPIPTPGSLYARRPSFELARRGGLKTTVHCGEVPSDPEMVEVVAFKPERLGHAVVLGEEVRQALLALDPPIPIEVCPTSNLLTLALSHHGEHPTVRGWITAG